MNFTTKQIFNGIAIGLTAMVLIFGAGRCSAPSPDLSHNEQVVAQLKVENQKLKDSSTVHATTIAKLKLSVARLDTSAGKSQAVANNLRRTNDRLLDSLKKVSQGLPDTCQQAVGAVITVAEGYKAEGDTLRHVIQIKNVELSLKDNIITEQGKIMSIDSTIIKNSDTQVSKLEKELAKVKHPKFMGIPLPSRTVSFIGGVVVTLASIAKFGLIL